MEDIKNLSVSDPPKNSVCVCVCVCYTKRAVESMPEREREEGGTRKRIGGGENREGERELELQRL